VAKDGALRGTRVGKLVKREGGHKGYVDSSEAVPPTGEGVGGQFTFQNEERA